MNQVHLVILIFLSNDGAVGLLALCVLSLNFEVFPLYKSLFSQSSRKTLGIIIQGRMGHDLVLADSDHLGGNTRPENKTQGQKNR